MPPHQQYTADVEHCTVGGNKPTPPPLLVNVHSFRAYVQIVGRAYDVPDAGEQGVLFLALDNVWHNDCAVRI